MLVRGHRIANIEAPEAENPQHLYVPADADAINNMTIAALIFIPALVIVAIYLGVNIRKIHRRRRGQ